MHTPVCNDALEWWPQGAPTDIAVASLPASGLLTRPIRLVGDGAWVGIWGKNFAGVRVGYGGNGQSFPVVNGTTFPYPIMPDGRGIDLYLSQDTGTGTFSIARFKSREAALSWAGEGDSGDSTPGLPNRSVITRDTVAGGVINHGWTQPGFLYALLVATAGNAAPIMIGSFPLAAGASLSGFVNAAGGFTGTGSNGDTLDIIEYGRI